MTSKIKQVHQLDEQTTWYSYFRRTELSSSNQQSDPNPPPYHSVREGGGGARNESLEKCADFTTKHTNQVSTVPTHPLSKNVSY